MGMNMKKLMNSLYENLDNMDINYLEEVLDDDVSFSISDNPVIIGKKNVIEANISFFKTIKAMKHDIMAVYKDEDEDVVFCHGSVHYTRNDKSSHSVGFSTILKLRDGKIIDYLVFVDLSGL